MKGIIKNGCCFLLAASLIFCQVGSGHAQEKEWEFIVAPYALLPSISGDGSLGRAGEADIDVDGGDILENLKLGGMIYLEAQHESGFGLNLMYAFMDLGDSASGPAEFTSFDLDIYQGIFEGYASYRFDTRHGPLDLYGGVRWWDIDVDLNVSGPRGDQSFNNRGDDWVDPVVGMRWIPRIAEAWHFIVKGDIGGFGVSSDFSWNIQSGFIWDAADYLSVVMQYRAVAVDYSTGTSGTPSQFSYDTITHGPQIGLAFKF